MVGGNLASSVHQHGQVVAWDGAPATVYDAVCHPRIAEFADPMVVVTAMGCPATPGDPVTMQPGARGTWNVRMVVESVVARLTRVGQVTRARQRRWPAVLARLSCTMALFNVVVRWQGPHVTNTGESALSIAHFRL